MPNDLLPQTSGGELALPKYSAWSLQLTRLELLLNACLNKYSDLGTPDGRAGFISAIEMLYIAIAPNLKRDDRMYLKSFIMKLRSMITSVNSVSQYGTGLSASIDIMQKQAWALLEVMSLLKDKRGLGIPKKEQINWKEELGASMDIAPEEEKKIQEEMEKDEVE